MCLGQTRVANPTGTFEQFNNMLYDMRNPPKPAPAAAPAPAPVKPNPTADGPVVGDRLPTDGELLLAPNNRRQRQSGIFSNVLTSAAGDPLFGGNTQQRATFGGR